MKRAKHEFENCIFEGPFGSSLGMLKKGSKIILPVANQWGFFLVVVDPMGDLCANFQLDINFVQVLVVF